MYIYFQTQGLHEWTRGFLSMLVGHKALTKGKILSKGQWTGLQDILSLAGIPNRNESQSEFGVRLSHISHTTKTGRRVIDLAVWRVFLAVCDGCGELTPEDFGWGMDRLIPLESGHQFNFTNKLKAMGIATE